MSLPSPDWQSDCGRVTLYCCDCLSLLPHIASGSVDAVVTSPPYLQQREYGGDGTAWDDLMDAMLFMPCVKDDGQVLVNLGLVHKSGECIPYWENWRERMRHSGWRFFAWYVWDQGDGLPGDWNGRLAPSHEFVFHFNKQVRRPDKWVPTKSANRTITGTGLRKKDGTTPTQQSHAGRMVQATKIPDSVIRVYREMRRNVDHPAVFPVEFPMHIIQSYCPIADVVLDPFMGSGTTGVACVKTGRKFIGIELEPKYFEIAKRRIKEELEANLFIGASA